MHRRDLFSRTGTHSGTTSITNSPAACDRDRTAESRGPIGPRQACLTTAATRLCGSGFGERRRSGSELFSPPAHAVDTHAPHTGRTGTCTSRASYVPVSLAGVEYRSRVTSCSRSDRSGYCVCPVPTLQPGSTDQSLPTSNFSLFPAPPSPSHGTSLQRAQLFNFSRPRCPPIARTLLETAVERGQTIADKLTLQSLALDSTWVRFVTRPTMLPT